MTRSRYVSFGLLFVWMIQTISASAQARVTVLSPQTLDFMSLDAAASTVVTGQPYSADGVTKVTQTLADGTRIEREVRSKFYRDSAGRVRREQSILGLDSLLGALNSEPQTAITITDPVEGTVYSLDPGRREARRMMLIIGDGYRRVLPQSAPSPAPTAAGDVSITSPSIITGPPGPTTPLPAPLPSTPPAPLPSKAPLAPRATPRAPLAPTVPVPAPKTESLGTRQIEGLSATGQRTTTTIPAGRIGNDRPIEILDERWVSSDLKVVLLSRHRDPQTGETEFRLTNIKRAEPSPDLFKVPANNTIILITPSRAPE